MPVFFSLQALHTDDPLTWDYVARRELEMESQPGDEPPTTKQAKVAEATRREERCCAVYEEAVKTLPTGEPHPAKGRGGGIFLNVETGPVHMTKIGFWNLSVVVYSVPGFPACSFFGGKRWSIFFLTFFFFKTFFF